MSLLYLPKPGKFILMNFMIISEIFKIVCFSKSNYILVMMINFICIRISVMIRTISPCTHISFHIIFKTCSDYYNSSQLRTQVRYMHFNVRQLLTPPLFLCPMLLSLPLFSGIHTPAIVLPVQIIPSRQLNGTLIAAFLLKV